ncbi:MAG: phage head closure protein [Rhizobiales bacterium]|nr:phage head closure protein [Hyphomicrobiales bacterium]
MTTISIGDLRHRLTLETPVDVPDGAGGFERTWQDGGVVWGRLKPLSGREFVAKGKLASRITHEITVRYRTDVLPSMRLRLATRVFEILAVIDDYEPGRWRTCHCEEVEH